MSSAKSSKRSSSRKGQELSKGKIKSIKKLSKKSSKRKRSNVMFVESISRAAMAGPVTKTLSTSQEDLARNVAKKSQSTPFKKH